MRQAWHVKVTYAQEILTANLVYTDHLVDPFINGSTIFQWTIRKEKGSGEGPVVGSCEHGNEYSNYVKCREFLTILTMVKMPKLQTFP